MITNKKIIWFIMSTLLVSWIAAFASEVLHLSDAPMTAVMIFPMLLVLMFMVISKDAEAAIIGMIAASAMGLCFFRLTG